MIYTWQVGQSHFGNRESLFWVHVRSNAVSPFVFWKTMVDSRIITRSRPSSTNLGHASFRSTWHQHQRCPLLSSTRATIYHRAKKEDPKKTGCSIWHDSFSTIQTLKGQPHMFEVPPKNPRWVPPDFPGVNGHFRYQFIGGTYHRFPNRRIPQHLHPVALSGTIVPSHGSWFCAAEIGVLQLKSVLENYRNHKQWMLKGFSFKNPQWQTWKVRNLVGCRCTPCN